MADAHYREAMVEHLSAYGVGAIDAPTDVASTYVRARTLFAHGLVRLPRHRQLIRDLSEVQQVPTAGGGLSIRLPKRPGGSHADSVAALVLALWQRGGEPIRVAPVDPMATWSAQERADIEREERKRREMRDEWSGGSDWLTDD